MPSCDAEHVQSQDETDARNLFLRSAGDVRRLAGNNEERPEESGWQGAHAPAQPQHAGENEQAEFLNAVRSIGTITSLGRPEETDEKARERSRSAARRLRQVKSGSIQIKDELDLHGYRSVEALHKLRSFIVDAWSRGHRAVLVITGKGNNSGERPVLRGAVTAWLQEQGRAWVVEFHRAPRDKGGEGALVVFLRQRAGIPEHL